VTATASGPMISTNLRIVAIAGSLALLVFIVELVRRRRLKEEYSVLWVATVLVLLLLSIWGGLLRNLAHLIGAGSQASALYFFGIIFIVFLLLHFSVRVSNLERRVVVLLQEVALLNERERRGAAGGERPPGPAELGQSTSEQETSGEDVYAEGALANDHPQKSPVERARQVSVR
jgi:hypothetical protein